MTDDFSGFLITFPCWVIVGSDTTTGINADTQMLTIESNGDMCMPVFTDKDLASRFVLDRGIKSAKLGAFDTKSQFLEFLKRLTYPFVVLDPTGASSKLKLCFDTKSMIEDLESN